MRKILSILAVILLIGMASAAVYITFTPEAKIWWSIDKPGPDVAEIQTLMLCGNGTFWSNTMTVEPDSDGVFNAELRFDNHNPTTVVGNVVITMQCDEGIFIEPSGLVRDFDSVMYFVNMVEYEGNVLSCIDVVDSETVRFIPQGICEFPHESSTHAELTVDMVGMAYGNYTCIINVESV